jgi:radical SAM superfamily enzyme YgiQ (UPF0313 family)
MRPIMPRIDTGEGGHAPWRPRNRRRILCVFPQYAPSFGTFQHAYPLLPGIKAFMPPQGILLIAAYLPRQWEVRFVDENIRPVADRDLAWADVVFMSGMHVQRRFIERINAAAHRHGKLTVLGGPSVSACPEYYHDVDVLHVGEIGDATDALFRMLDRSVERSGRHLIFETGDRLDLTKFPRPAYHLLNLRHYFLGSIQFSSGCPFLCEFCDIPALYGRNPRLKAPQQIMRELDAMLAAGVRGAVYFVDDNFIANPGAAREMLPHLVDWQRRNHYPIEFSCEATLNLAQQDDILEQMQQAAFRTVFCGIETPEPHALPQLQKKQNIRRPILESIERLNRYGMEVVSGIIMGLDTDSPDTDQRILDFIRDSKIPMLTVNLLYALPKTKLHDRLKAEGRLIDDPHRASNVDFKMPYEQVLKMWRRVIGEAYEPAALFDRFRAQAEVCFAHRPRLPRKPSREMIRHGLGVMSRTLYHVGLRADYRCEFWKFAAPLLARGRVEEVLHAGIVSHHLIQFTRDCQRSGGEPAFYADPNRGATSAGPLLPPTSVKRSAWRASVTT